MCKMNWMVHSEEQGGVYGDIEEAARNGVQQRLEQCRPKIKNLKKRYRAVKDHNGETGKGRMTMKFYRELDCILGHRPASVPATLLDTGIGSSTTGDSQGSAEETETNGKCLKFT